MNVNVNTKTSSAVITKIGAGVLALGAAGAIFGVGSAAASPVPGSPSGYHEDHVVSPGQNQGIGPQGAGHGTIVVPGNALQPGNVSDDSRTANNSGPNAAAPIDSGDHPRSNPGFDNPLAPF